MSWTFEEIRTGWLGESTIAVRADEIVAAFERVERVLGRPWIDSHAAGRPGTAPTLHVAHVGQQLASLENVPHRPLFTEKLRTDDVSAFAELAALHLLRNGRDHVQAEVLDETAAPDGVRVPDLRVREDSGDWTSVEVSRPDESELYQRANDLIAAIAGTVHSIPGSFALEVFFRREPSEQEAIEIRDAISAFCAGEGRQVKDLPGLALLFLNNTAPGQISLDDHGEPVAPRIAVSSGIVQPGGSKHIAVRLPFSDQRAERVLKREAEQITEGAPGLVMIDIANAPGSFTSWVPLIKRRFQPTLLTRVGAVCLFTGGQGMTGDGAATILTETRLIINPHARHPLPEWIIEQLTQHQPKPKSGKAL